jgi:hypothetical protein
VDTTRREALRASLVRELERETIERHLGSADRVDWLVRQLEEHLGRWLGFCAVSEAPMSMLVNSVLFDAVEISTGAVDEELLRTGASRELLAAWHPFKTSLEAVRSAMQKDEVTQLKESLARFHAQLGSARETGGQR